MAKPRQKKVRQSPQAIAPSTSSSLVYEVEMTRSAETVYKDLYRKAKEAELKADYTNSNCTTFDMVKDVVKRIIPGDPINRKYALRGELSNVFRIRKGRMRICWIASSKHRRVCILFISETLRKEGDASDPYVILQQMVDSGTLDALFSQFGVRMPRLHKEGHLGMPQ